MSGRVVAGCARDQVIAFDGVFPRSAWQIASQARAELATGRDEIADFTAASSKLQTPA